MAGVMDPGSAHHRKELLQAARARGPALRLRRPAGDPAAGGHGGHPQHSTPGALADSGANHQQPRRHCVTHPGELAPQHSKEHPNLR